MWFFYALLSALTASVRRTNEKRISQTMHHFTVGWTVQALSLPLIGFAIYLSHGWLNPFKLGPHFWLPLVAMWVLYYPLNTYCYVNAYRTGEFSKILPLQSLAPVLALVVAWVTLGQRPSLVATIAIMLVAASVYVLNMKGRRLHNPLHMFTRDKPNLFMLGSILLSAGTAPPDVVAIRASNPLIYSLISAAGASVVLYSIGRVSGVREQRQIRFQYRGLALSGALLAFSYSSYLFSVQSGPVSYALAVRSSSIFMGAAIGIIWLGEKLTLQKLIAFIGMAAGLTMFAIAG